MENDNIKGKANEAVGAARKKAGEMTGNEEMEAKGAAQETKGEAQQALGKGKDALKKVGDALGS
ncbi:MAG: CsbD family protein [Tepidiformaceae bacterium]